MASRFIIDAASGALYRDFTGRELLSENDLLGGETGLTPTIEVYAITIPDGGGTPTSNALTDADLDLVLGHSIAPDSGLWSISFGADQSAPVSVGALNPSAITSALAGLDDAQAAGGFDVETSGDGYLITAREFGAVASSPLIITENLSPPTACEVSSIAIGDADTRAQWFLKLVPSAAASIDGGDWSTVSSGSYNGLTGTLNLATDALASAINRGVREFALSINHDGQRLRRGSVTINPAIDPSASGAIALVSPNLFTLGGTSVGQGDAIAFDGITYSGGTLTSGSVEENQARSGQASGIKKIFGLGDSTFTTTYVARSLPDLIADRLGVPYDEHAKSGYIPRHLVWDYLLQKSPTILATDLAGIPPSQAEDRTHQNGVDATLVANTRTFYADTAQVWVHFDSPGDDGSLLFEYDAASTATVDGTTVIESSGGTGRWLVQAGTFAPDWSSTSVQDSIFVVWMMHNDVDAEDGRTALRMLKRNLGPNVGKLFAMTLPNRFDSGHADVAVMGQWIEECNNMLREECEHVVEVENWMLGRGGDYYYTTDSGDLADIAAGRRPGTLFGTGSPNLLSHPSDNGNDEISRFVADHIATECRGRSTGIITPTIIRRWRADTGLKSMDSDRRVHRLTGIDTSDAHALTIETGRTPPRYMESGWNGRGVLDFDGVLDGLACDFSVQSQANTYIVVGRWGDVSSRGDMLDRPDSIGTDTDRHIFYADTNYKLYAGSVADSGVVADTAPHVFIARYDGASSALWVDGTKTATSTVGTTGLQGVAIGGAANTAMHFKGQVGELIVMNTAISDGEATAISAQLRQDWSITGN